MGKIKITFPDKSVKEFSKGVTGLEIAKAIGPRLAKDALAIKVDGEAKDLNSKIGKDAKIEIITFESDEGKDVFWHSASHLMTQAVLRVFKDQTVGLGVGTPVEGGFYQDYGMRPLHPEDLKKIEAEMSKIVSEKLDIRQKDIPKKEALDFYKKDPYKTELTNAVEGNTVSMYKQGEFDNLCKGPHVPNTSYLKAFKLTKVAGAYWRGDEKNKMLQRIYGIAFPSEKELKKFLSLREEAEKRNHITLGHKLGLFSIHQEAPGFPFIKPKGMIMWNAILDYWREEHEREGYELVQTPLIMRKTLWETSGHWDHYKENMYFTEIDEADFAVKPMNCPGGILIYKEDRHSYKELPMRIAELGVVHRHERSGVLNGLFRVRKFVQDDAHIYFSEEQAEEEIIKVIELTDRMYKTFGFKEYDVELSTKPEKAMGSDEMWEKATNALKKALEKKKIAYRLNEGDGAFYGPKIDFHIKDCLGRSWQCATIQLDFSMPERFDLYYIGEDDKKHRPVMIHRVVLGSIERFLGVLIEHYAGEFPVWLSPVQVRIITVNDSLNKYAEEISGKMKEEGIRVELDLRKESIGRKVRDAELEKVPYLLTVGEKEKKGKSVSVRNRKGEVKLEKVEKFIDRIGKEIAERTI